MKNNRKFNSVLGISILVIWGLVGYKLFETFTSESETEETSIPSTHIEKGTKEHFVYGDDVRDPFYYVIDFPKKVPVKKQAIVRQEVVWSPPPFRLTGIVADNRARSATLETTDGKIYFLSEGDTLLGMKLLKIAGKTVSYSYHEKNGEFTLDIQ